MIFTKVKTNSLRLVAALLLSCALMGRAQAFELATDKFVLDNGMTVVVTEMPSSPMVSVYGLVQTGSAREGSYMGSGISHFLEHMLFKGTHGREVGEIARQIQAVGGNLNASTSHDFTIYTINVPSDHFDLALDVLSDMLFNAKIDPVETEKEREVIYAEMRMLKDNPDRWISTLGFRNAYKKHPYQHPVIGYKDLFAKITREGLWDYYKKHYSPNNTILSVAGNINADEVKAKIREKLSSLPRESLQVEPVANEPRQINARYYEEEYPTDLTRLSLTYQGISLHHEDLYALDVLAQILGQGESSRLYQDLYKNKQLVYSVYSSNFTPVDPGLFEIEGLLEEENLKEVQETILSHVDMIKTKLVKEDELLKAKRQVLSSYVHSSQKASSVAWHQAVDEAFAGDYSFSQKYVEKIKEVTAEEILRVANQYLVPDTLSITVLRPIAQAGTKEAQVKPKPAPIEKHVLVNGLTILLRRDNTFPLASVQLFLKGGQLGEPEGYWGLSQLMANVWIKGTTSFTSSQIEEETEKLGMDVSSYSGKNSFGISMNLLAEDLNDALSLLEDIVKHPTFPQEEMDRKKKDMLTALIQREEDVFALSSYGLRKNLYGSHPYAYDTVGTKESLERLTREHLDEYYRNFVKPNNMVVAVFGDIDPKVVLENLTKKFSDLKKRKIDFKDHSVEEIKGPKEIPQTLNKEQAMVTVGFPGVDLFSEERYGLEILESILGSSFNGRLFESVREKLGKAYTMGGGSIPGLDPGYIFFYVLTEKNAVDTVKKIIFDEIGRLQTELVPLTELEDIKTYLKGSYKAGLETNAALAFAASLDELYGLGYENYKLYAAMIDRISAANIKELANKYLDQKKSVTIITAPEAVSAPEEGTK